MKLQKILAAGAVACALALPSAALAQVLADDLMIGVNSSVGPPFDSFRHIRAGVGATPGVTVDGGALVSSPSPWDQSFIQSVEFDNANGISHNASGNMLGANAGFGFTGFEIYNFATDGTGTFESLWGINAQTGGAETDTGGGLSVNPSNNLIGWANTTDSQLTVMPYSAGATVGTGAGGSITGWIETADGNGSGGSGLLTPIGTNTTGTAWLDDDTLIAVNAFGELISWDVSSLVAGATDPTTPVTSSNWVTETTGVFAGAAQYIDIEYNAAIDPDHIIVSRGQFPSAAGQGQQIIVLDSTTFAVENTISLNNSVTDPGSTATLREIAYDSQGNLYIGGFGENIVSVIPNFAANAETIADDSSVFWFNNDFFASFSGLDVAASVGGTKVPGDTDGDGDVDLLDLDALGANFGLATGATCAEGDFDGDGDVDLLDLDILGANFGTGVPSASVPEPTALALAALAACSLIRRRS